MKRSYKHRPTCDVCGSATREMCYYPPLYLCPEHWLELDARIQQDIQENGGTLAAVNFQTKAHIRKVASDLKQELEQQEETGCAPP